MRQLITPNPDIPCQPGWCLAYVNEAFGVEKRYGSATAAWHGSTTQHTGRDFPPGVWVPVWYALDTNEHGHVVLMAPDGSVYSTSDLTNTPYHHPNLKHLEWFYAHYGMTLTYRGWTEDVENTPVLAPFLSYQSATVNPLEGVFDMLTEQQQKDIYWQLCTPEGRKAQADLNAQALLDAPVDGLDSAGNIISTTLRTKIRYMAPNHTQLHNLVANIHDALAKDTK